MYPDPHPHKASMLSVFVRFILIAVLLFTWSGTTYAQPPAQVQTQMVNFMPFLPNSPYGYSTTLVLRNLATKSIDLSLSFYPSTGAPAIPYSDSIAAQSTLYLSLSSISTLSSGNYSLVINSADPFESLARVSNSSGNVLATYTGQSSGQTNLAFGPFTSTSSLFVQNLGSSTAFPTVTLYSAAGSAPYTLSPSIAAGASWMYTGSSLSAGVYWAQVTSTGEPLTGLVVSHLSSSSDVEMQPPLSAASSTTFLPRALKSRDEGKGAYSTQLLVVNPDETNAANPAIHFFRSGENILKDDLTIPAKGAALVDLAGESGLSSNSAWSVFANSTVPIYLGELTDSDAVPAASAFASYPGIEISAETGSAFDFPYLILDNSNASILSIFNRGTTPTTPTIKYYNSSGGLVYTQTAANLPPGLTNRIKLSDVSQLGSNFSGSATVSSADGSILVTADIYHTLVTVATLSDLNIRVNDTYITGTTNPDIDVTLTLKRGGAQISQIHTHSNQDSLYITNPGYFSGNFGQNVLAGDQVVVDLPGPVSNTFNVPVIALNLDKGTNIISGQGSQNGYVNVEVYSNTFSKWASLSGQTDGSGNFSFDFTQNMDILLGDYVILDFQSSNNVASYSYTGLYVPGVNINPEYDDVTGYAPPGTTVNLTLKASNGTVKATAAPSADYRGYFYSYFYTPAQVDIAIGDILEMQYGSQPIQTVHVVDVAATAINPTTDVVSGKAPANSKVEVAVRDGYQNTYGNKIVQAGADGKFTADFSSGVSSVANQPSAADLIPALSNQQQSRENNDFTEKQNLPTEQGDEAGGAYSLQSQDPGGSQTLPSASSAGSRISTALSQAELAAKSAPAINPKRLGVPELGGASPEQTRERDAGVDVQVTDSAFDILPGSYTTPVYHDPNDNEVTGPSLYAGPYVKLTLSNYSSYIYYEPLWVTGQPNEHIQATLRNALGAIKATASGVIDSSGELGLSLTDTLNNTVSLAPNDTLEVKFSSGITRLVTVENITYLIDRDGGKVSGKGPANRALRVEYSSGSGSKDVTTGADGSFTVSDLWLSGGSTTEIYDRNPQGDDIVYVSPIPQFTVYPDEGYLSGLGPANQAYVVHLNDGQGNVLGTIHGTISSNSRYYVYFSQSIPAGDVVTVDIGALHFEQPIVALTVAADPVTNIVSGTAPSEAWLNVFAWNNNSPYNTNYYHYFYAGSDGNHTSSFSQVRGGDCLEVLYWEDGHKDQVDITRYVPFLAIDPVENLIWGYAGSGDNGSVTVRNSSNAVKANANVTASVPYGRFSLNPGVDLVPGDTGRSKSCRLA